MSYPLVRSSRPIVQLTVSEKSMLSTVIRRRSTRTDEDMVESDPNFNARYMDRPTEHESISLLDMAKNFRYYNKGWHKFRTEAVVRIIPDLNDNIPPFSEKWELFCEQQVLLHHHYRNLNEAKGNFDTWSERYIDLGLIQPGSLSDAIEDEFEIDNDLNDIEENQQEEWMMAAAMGPLFTLGEEVEIGLRDFDTSYNWNESLQRYPNIDIERNFIHTNLRSAVESTNECINESIVVPLEKLSDNQRIAHDMIYKNLLDGKSIRMIVCGGAGTGKSTLINAIVQTIVTHFGTSKAVRIMAPTGVAAFNIGGSTIHHELSISTERKSSYKEISGEQCRRMQDDFKDTKLIIIDEYSMLGRTMIANIDLHCRDIFSVNDLFGGVSVVLVGDMRQLPPVCDSSLYIEGGNLLQQRGGLAYVSFDKCIKLSYIFRQAGDEQAPLREALERLSRGASTLDDWKLFKTRDWLTLSSEVKETFKNALYLFPTRMAANELNKNRLIQLGKPIARIPSFNNCEMASNASFDDAKGLEKCIYLSLGARVMLRSNLSLQNGLVNGAMGTVVDIVYSQSSSSPNDLPLAVMVDFDKYHGTRFRQGTNIIPITPQTVNWKTSSGTTCMRTQLPLVLCWAITIHKSQGLTLDQAIIDIGDRESLGLTFVALSRTRKLEDLAFNPMFTFERLARIGNCKGLPSRLLEEERLNAMSLE